MAELRLAGNLTALNRGHLQIVLVKDDGTQV